MAHRSRLSTLVIDCNVDDLAPHIAFWSAALGKRVADADTEDDGRYAELRTDDDELKLLLQRVDHAPRVHLDIESDDVDAEADRLEALGARRIGKVRTWWVMEAPSGHRFCVIRPQRATMDPHANTWDAG